MKSISKSLSSFALLLLFSFCSLQAGNSSSAITGLNSTEISLYEFSFQEEQILEKSVDSLIPELSRKGTNGLYRWVID